MSQDRNHSSAQTHRPTNNNNNSFSAFLLRKLRDNLAGILTLRSIFLLVFFSPLIIFSSPIWVPAGIFFFLFAAGFLSVYGFCVVTVTASSWLYRYFRGLHPPGSNFMFSFLYILAGFVVDSDLNH
ncbi:oleosin [Trifolium pratense]|uniref:Oleosin n=1 Tax=Trifolium pratense TaxID=57577 RepID=A0A2K3K709_TRIPR|nr:oleosin [Trifolium pratense]